MLDGLTLVTAALAPAIIAQAQGEAAGTGPVNALIWLAAIIIVAVVLFLLVRRGHRRDIERAEFDEEETEALPEAPTVDPLQDREEVEKPVEITGSMTLKEIKAAKRAKLSGDFKQSREARLAKERRKGQKAAEPAEERPDTVAPTEEKPAEEPAEAVEPEAAEEEAPEEEVADAPAEPVEPDAAEEEAPEAQAAEEPEEAVEPEATEEAAPEEEAAEEPEEAVEPEAADEEAAAAKAAEEEAAEEPAEAVEPEAAEEEAPEEEVAEAPAEAVEPEAAEEEAPEEEAAEEEAAKAPVEPTPEPVADEAEPEPKDEERTTLRDGLTKTRKGFIARLGSLFSGRAKLDDDLIEELEEVLFTADIGVKTSQKLLELVEKRVADEDIEDPQVVWKLLRDETAEILRENARPLTVHDEDVPFVILMVGVNGVGKTTTIGKLADQFMREGKSVHMVAGDTFRAAAVEQLAEWANRVDCPIFSGPEGRDPSAVVYDGITEAIEANADVVLVDTAGRLHTKAPLIDELKKIARVAGKALDGAPHETVLVLDANTGQNAIQQAQLFDGAVDLTGVILTKLDGTAKGGVIIGISDELQIPIYHIGIGESVYDLRPFDADEFVDALF